MHTITITVALQGHEGVSQEVQSGGGAVAGTAAAFLDPHPSGSPRAPYHALRL